MWVRKLGRKGPVIAVVLPAAAVRELKWELGDFVMVQVLDSKYLLVSKFDPVQVPDRVLEAIKPLQTIYA